MNRVFTFTRLRNFNQQPNGLLSYIVCNIRILITTYMHVMYYHIEDYEGLEPSLNLKKKRIKN